MPENYAIVKKAERFFFLENGKAQLMLGGEVHNFSASTVASMAKNVWPYVVDIGLNTLLIPVYWEDIEKEPGVFTFDLIDDHLENAAKHQIKVIFLWFGLWKNGLSAYVPSWVKTNRSEYFHVVAQNYEPMNCISPFCEQAVTADCQALAQFSQYLSQHPLKDQVCMLQLQNEVGCLTKRDYSAAAQHVYQAELPSAVKKLFPEASDWSELTDEVFMAYGFSQALEKMAQTVKQSLALPLFTNAWVQKEGKQPGDYPSGGPTKHVLSIWQALAPSLSALAPDVYEENYQEIINDYQVLSQPLLIPETRKDLKYISNSFYAFGRGALLYSPFGIEDIKKYEVEVIDEDYEFLKQLGLDKAAFNPAGSLPYLKQCYSIIDSVTPFLVDDTIQPIPFKKEGTASFCHEDQEYRLTVKYLSTEAVDQLNSAGFFFKLQASYYFVGCNIAIFHEAVDPQRKSELLQLEEGYFDNGQWQVERVLNGDERYMPYIGNRPKIIKLALYSYER